MCPQEALPQKGGSQGSLSQESLYWRAVKKGSSQRAVFQRARFRNHPQEAVCRRKGVSRKAVSGKRVFRAPLSGKSPYPCAGRTVAGAAHDFGNRGSAVGPGKAVFAGRRIFARIASTAPRAVFGKAAGSLDQSRDLRPMVGSETALGRIPAKLISGAVSGAFARTAPTSR